MHFDHNVSFVFALLTETKVTLSFLFDHVIDVTCYYSHIIVVTAPCSRKTTRSRTVIMLILFFAVIYNRVINVIYFLLVGHELRTIWQVDRN